jgi:hypothetical protein
MESRLMMAWNHIRIETQNRKLLQQSNGRTMRMQNNPHPELKTNKKETTHALSH